jgi:hypothetical protein
MNIPNLNCLKYSHVDIDVLLLIVVRGDLNCGECLIHRLLLAGRKPIARLHPLCKSRLAVPYGPTDLDEGRSVAAHARLGKEGGAYVEEQCCFFRLKQPGGLRGSQA